MSAEPTDPQAALIDRLSEDELLDILGPSWSAMSPAGRSASRASRQTAARKPFIAAIERETTAILVRRDQSFGAPTPVRADAVSDMLVKYRAARARIQAEKATVCA